MDSTIQATATKWYSALQLPSVASTTNSNRVNPLLPAKTAAVAAAAPATTKRVSTSPSLVVKYDQSPTTITHLFKRLARTPSMSIKNANNSWLNLSLNKKKEEQQEDVHIHMKSPHVVANGELAGTLVIQLQQQEVDTIESIDLSFVGTEAVINSQHHSSNDTITTQEEFLNLNILSLTSTKGEIKPYLFDESALVTPFFTTLPSQLGGTFIDKKGSIQYHLHTEITYTNNNNQEDEEAEKKETKCARKSVIVYPNVASLKSYLDLYLASTIESKEIKISLSRSVWMSGAPVYVTIKTSKVCDNIKMKLELLRKQNTCCISREDDSIVPLTSTCEVIATSSLLDNIKYDTKDHHFIMAIDAPVNQVTVSNQKMIDVSFAIRVLAHYLKESTETVLSEMPIMLVHPVAMDPPPLLSSPTSEEEESAKITTGKITTSAPKLKPLLESSASYTSSLTSSSTNPRISSVSLSHARHHSPLIRRSTPSAQPITKKPLEKMKRSFSTWGTKLSRKMSMTRINSQQQMVNKSRPEISSPILSHYSDSSEEGDEGDNESIMSSSLYASPKQDLNNMMMRSSQQRRSVMKFGQMKGPKRFGQQPGSLGDAGLDIRNCFNVAKVTEVIQSYAAEKVELPDDIAFDCSSDEEDEEDDEEVETPKNNSRIQYPPYLEPIQLEEQFVWKEGFIAPPEKCQLDISMLEQDINTSNGRKKYPEGNKRMLASSRHLMQQQQRKNSASQQQVLLSPSSV